MSTESASGNSQGSGERSKASKDTLIVAFEDNRLLSQLFGEHDQHLALLEDRLGIEATPRGNHVALNGPPEACRSARKVLDEIYERIKQGIDIGPGEVDGSIRMNTMPQSATRTTGSKEDVVIRTKRRTISPRSPKQHDYIHALQNHELTFGVGPAGTGKTYLAVAVAAAALAAGEVDKIILSRPAVEAGERLGFLPGDMKEKVDPYLRPLYDALYDMLPGNQVNRDLEEGTIEIAPLAFMRGRTLAHSFIILDEAQNCTSMQMKMFLTRLGENSRMAVTGDPTQIDLPKGQVSGLVEAFSILKSVDEIGRVTFTDTDVVRHHLVAKIVRAYDGVHGHAL